MEEAGKREDVETAVICKGYYCVINGKAHVAPTAEELVKTVLTMYGIPEGYSVTADKYIKELDAE